MRVPIVSDTDAYFIIFKELTLFKPRRMCVLDGVKIQ